MTQPFEPDTPDGPSSWEPVDLRAYLDGSYAAPQPTLLPRDDGQCLLYRGKVHSLVGESESGKSLIAQMESIRLINLGYDVLYIDFEDQAAGVIERMRTFGAHPNALMTHFHYVNPETSFRTAVHDLAAWRELLDQEFALVVIDGVNDSLSMFGLSSNAGDEVSEWLQNVARRLARKTGGAVLLIDHVTKSHEGRGRNAIGSEKKLSGLDGCSYVVEPTTMPRKGHVGWITLKVGKDRPGGVRPNCGPPGKDRQQLACTIKIDSTGPYPRVWWNAPEETEVVDKAPQDDRLLVAMEKASAVLAEAGEPLTKNAVAARAGGARGTALAAIDELYRMGYVELEDGPRRSVLVKAVQQFIAAEAKTALVLTDTPLVPGTSEGLVLPPPPYGGVPVPVNPAPVSGTGSIDWSEALSLANVTPITKNKEQAI